jgi:hypothetical protein
MTGCPYSKDVFKMRAGHEREITITLTQSSKQQMIVQAAVGLLVGEGGQKADMLQALELTSEPHSIGKTFVVSGNWKSKRLQEETGKDVPYHSFTVAVDVHVAGLSEILRLRRTIKARVYKANERFFNLKGGKGNSATTLEVNLQSKSNTEGEVEFTVVSIVEKDAEEKKGYMNRLTKSIRVSARCACACVFVWREGVKAGGQHP